MIEYNLMEIQDVIDKGRSHPYFQEIEPALTLIYRKISESGRQEFNLQLSNSQITPFQILERCKLLNLDYCKGREMTTVSLTNLGKTIIDKNLSKMEKLLLDINDPAEI